MARLLLVDPNVMERGLVAQHLRERGYEILESNDIEEAKRLAGERDAALVVSEAAKAEMAASEASASTQTAVTRTARAPRLVGESTGMRQLREEIDRLASLPGTHVFVVGEPGSGKSTAARALHAKDGAGRPFVQVTSQQVCELLLSSRVVKGNGTPEVERLWEAGGTLFIPSATELSPELQARLVRFTEELELRNGPALRLIAALADEPQRALRAGTLTKEFSARFPVTLTLEPLRRRKSDIPPLALYLLAERAAELGRTPPGPSPEAMEQLGRYDWPGNVRELANVVEGMLLRQCERIDVGDLPSFQVPARRIDYRLPHDGIDFADLEREVLTQALRLARGNQTRAASLLNLTRDQLRYRMAKFGLFGPLAPEQGS
jgi:two-component system, NtrC family, response regulator AtoC